MSEHILTTFAAVFFAGSFCQWLAWRLKLPAIIFLLTAGILAGPVLGILNPETLMGDILFPFVSLSVAIILFEGSLTLKFKEILGLQKVVRNMISFGMLITWIITAVTAHYAVGISWEISFLFGAIMVVTGPTVIVPMLRTVRPNATIANILKWEGIVIDPIGASLAVLVYEFIISGGGEAAIGRTLLTFSQIVGVGFIIGSIGGYFFGLILRNHWLPEFLHIISMLGLVLGTYTVSNLLQHESGLVTVTVLGIWLANMKDVDIKEILDFKENLSILLISVLFILLAARLDFSAVEKLGWAAVFVFLAIQFLARPLNIVVSALHSKLTWPERHLLAWIAPRGIVAAAISALFAIQLTEAGFVDAGVIVPLTFTVIIGTVLLQSLTASPIANLLGVAEPDPKGFLIIGANIVGRNLALALENNGFRAIVTDTDWDKIAQAKMDGLTTYLGNPISEHADQNLDLVGIGRMIAVYPHESMNISAVMHYRMELGPRNVFATQSTPNACLSDRLKVSKQKRGNTLFNSDMTYSILANVFSKDGEIKTTKITDTFSYNTYLEKNQDKIVPLFAIDPKNNIHVFSHEHPPVPKTGWLVISLYSQVESLKKSVQRTCQSNKNFD